MNGGIEDNLGEKQKVNGSGATAATTARPIVTTGEVFPDGSIVELIGGDHNGNLQLMLWNGASETIGSTIEHGGVAYEPSQFPSSLLRGWTLPTKCRPHGTTRQLLAQICKLFEDYAGLPERPASLVGRCVLSSWVVEAAQIAPALVLVGPDTMRGKRLVALLHCLCRHALQITGLTPAGLRSLPSGAGFTFLISQPTISESLERLLQDASHRDQKIPYRGGLLDLFGAQVIHAESIPSGESFSLRSIQIPLIPDGAQLPVFDLDVQHRITADFQSKLLNFRRTNLSAACKLQFDSSKFSFPMRELAHGIAVATPDDSGLQAELFDLLREKDEEIRDGKWIELSAVAVESMLVPCSESSGGVVYIGELSEIAQEILTGRGGDSAIDPGAFGKRLKLLGFRTEPRDAKGMKIRLTEEVCRRARQLARDFGVPGIEDATAAAVAAKDAE